MMEISQEELKKIKGGGISMFAVAGITALTIFITGIIDGIVHPRGCGE